jgi:hypothetical protein
VAGTVLALEAISGRGRNDEADAIEDVAAVTSTKESRLSMNVELRKRLRELSSSSLPLPSMVVIGPESDRESSWPSEPKVLVFRRFDIGWGDFGGLRTTFFAMRIRS